jgi:NADH:ubiquinone oxidoreductase subunit D
MAKDKRYKTIKTLIATGHVVRFMQILELDVVPKTIIARDLGMHHQTFEKLLKDPERFTYKQAFRIASLIEVDAKVMVDLIYAQCIENKK